MNHNFGLAFSLFWVEQELVLVLVHLYSCNQCFQSSTNQPT